MTRLAITFARTSRPKTAPRSIAFVTAGDPSPAHTPAILDAIVAGGADVIELGMPFTDPMADGPAIQAANLPAQPRRRHHDRRDPRPRPPASASATPPSPSS